jgi:hypothetical protein
LAKANECSYRTSFGGEDTLCKGPPVRRMYILTGQRPVGTRDARVLLELGQR